MQAQVNRSASGSYGGGAVANALYGPGSLTVDSLQLARRPAEPQAFALGVVDAARASTLGRRWLDDGLVDRLRRVQLWKRVPTERASPPIRGASSTCSLPRRRS